MAGFAILAHDMPVGRDLEDAAIPDVGNDDVAIGQDIGIVGAIEQACRASGLPHLAILPDEFLAGVADDLDDMLVFEIDDDLRLVRREEGVVRPRSRRDSLEFIFPDDLPVGRDHDDAIVAPVGNHHVVTAKRTGIVRNLCHLLRGSGGGLRRQHQNGCETCRQRSRKPCIEQNRSSPRRSP